MIRFQGVSVWRPEWGDPTAIFVAALATVSLSGGFFKILDAGRVGWPGDAFFADRIDDPVKFYAILAGLGIGALGSLVAVLSMTWDLVATWRRDSGRGS